ncbi:MAG: arsenite methyltransferase [Candidatus Hodarchaeota archaeon]
MQTTDQDDIRQAVRETYGKVARVRGIASGTNPASSCCGPSDISPETNAAVSCGCGGAGATLEQMSMAIGYSKKDVDDVPEGSNMGLGCGNPVALASLKPGETVVDLGSGGGFDCFLAAKQVGETGTVIGVDMTPEMIRKATKNVTKGGFKNVEFRLGEIEKIPLKDNFADVVISNCVVNLSPDKPKVFREAYRILKPGGRLFISDMLMNRALPEQIIKSVAGYIGCISGAETKQQYLEYIKDAGFSDVKIISESFFDMDMIAAFLDSLELEIDEICGDEISSVKFAAIK